MDYFNLSERKSESKDRHFLSVLCNNLSRIAKETSKGPSRAGVGFCYSIREMIGLADGAYDMASRAVIMIGQIRDESWKVAELAGVERATEQVFESLAWSEGDSPITAAVKSYGLIVDDEEGEPNIDVMNGVTRYVERVKKARSVIGSIVKALKEARESGLEKLSKDKTKRNKLCKSLSKKYKEAVKCLH